MFNTASLTTQAAGLGHLALARFIHNTALDQLKQVFVHRKAGQKEDLALGNGRTAVWWRYNLPGTVTTTVAEGVGDAPQGTPGSKTISANLSQYAAAIVLSDQLVDTAPDRDILSTHAEQLGYQAAYSADTMFRAVMDAHASNVGVKYTPLGSPAVLTRKDAQNVRTLFRSQNIKTPEATGNFLWITHPFNIFDLENDPQILSYGDIYRYSKPDKLTSLPDNDGTACIVVDNCEFVESTNVFVNSTNGTYRNYIIGRGALGIVDLATKGVSEVVNPNRQRFRVSIRKPQGNEMWDPAGLIGGTVAYNFSTTGVVLDGDPGNGGGTYRFRIGDFATTASTS